MESFKNEKKDGSSTVEKIKKGLKVLTVLAGIGLATSGKAEADGGDEYLTKILASTESISNTGTEKSAGDVFSSEFVKKIFADGKISVVEARSVRKLWEEFKPSLPDSMTTGEAGAQTEEVLVKLEEVAHKEEDLEIAKLELAIASTKMQILYEQSGNVLTHTAVTEDPFAEGQMVEGETDTPDSSVHKSPEELQAEMEVLTKQLNDMGANEGE